MTSRLPPSAGHSFAFAQFGRAGGGVGENGGGRRRRRRRCGGTFRLGLGFRRDERLARTSARPLTSARSSTRARKSPPACPARCHPAANCSEIDSPKSNPAPARANPTRTTTPPATPSASTRPPRISVPTYPPPAPASATVRPLPKSMAPATTFSPAINTTSRTSPPATRRSAGAGSGAPHRNARKYPAASRDQKHDQIGRPSEERPQRSGPGRRQIRAGRGEERRQAQRRDEHHGQRTQLDAPGGDEAGDRLSNRGGGDPRRPRPTAALACARAGGACARSGTAGSLTDRRRSALGQDSSGARIIAVVSGQWSVVSDL